MQCPTGARDLLVAVSVVVLVTASVVAAGGTAAAQVGDSTPARPGPDASDATAERTGETIAPTETTTESGGNRTTDDARRDNSSGPTKENGTADETTESGRIAVVNGSDGTGSTPPPGPPDDPSDPGDTGSPGARAPPDDAGSGPKVSVRRIEPAAVDAVVRNVVVRNAEARRSVSVDVSPGDSPADVTFDAVEVTPATDASFTLNVTSSDDPIAGETPTANLSNGAKPLAFVSVDHSIADRNVSNVTFRFRVRKERVNASEPDEIALYRYHGGSWNELPTTLSNVTDSHFVYRVRSPGLSEFAAGKQMPQFEIADAAFEFTTLSVGDALEVRVRVTNEGDADGTFTADLVLGDETVASHKLTIAADGMRQTTFDRQVADPGTYEVYVNDYHIGEVTVNGSVAASGGPTSPASTGGTSATDGTTGREAATSLPGFGLAAAVGTLVAALAAVVVAGWRRRAE